MSTNAVQTDNGRSRTPAPTSNEADAQRALTPRRVWLGVETAPLRRYFGLDDELEPPLYP